MLEVRELECVRGDHRLFTGLNFSLQAGELLHLKGSNGSGKTTLLRTVCGLMNAADGEILWQGENIKKVRDEFFSQLAYLGHLGAIKEELTAIENLRSACHLSGMHVADDVIMATLEEIGLFGREDLPTKVLSQGQKKRVALARLLVIKTTLWVLDEPFNALDVGAVDLLKNLIKKHVEEGGMVILTTHQDVNLDHGVMKQVDLSS